MSAAILADADDSETKASWMPHEKTDWWCSGAHAAASIEGTGLTIGRYVRGMIRKRSVYDPLEPTTEPRWYEVRDMHDRVSESRLLPPGTDLKRGFVAAMLEHIDAGWQLGEFGSRGGVFFCTRGTERRVVSIMPTVPGTPRTYGAAHLSESPGHDD